jgi:hypothetical protein
VLDIVHFDEDFEIEEVLGPCLGGHLEFVDIAARFADDLGHLSESADLVVNFDLDAGGKPLVVTDRLPSQIDPTFGLGIELLESLREDRINDDAFAGSADADDALARHRAGAAEDLQGGIAADASDRQTRTRLLGLLAARPEEPAALARCRALDGHPHSLQNVLPRKLATPNRSERIFSVLVPQARNGGGNLRLNIGTARL